MRISKTMSYALRHHPEKFDLIMDDHGWVETAQLLKGLQKKFPHLKQADMDEVVARNDKHRFSYDADHPRIRANQGHSIPVDVEMEEKEPPEVLYHGTGQKSVPAILKEGLKPMSRLFVHLSKDPETARKTGLRHGHPVVFLVEAGQMHRDGYSFQISANGVWQTAQVPPQYLHIIQK